MKRHDVNALIGFGLIVVGGIVAFVHPLALIGIPFGAVWFVSSLARSARVS